MRNYGETANKSRLMASSSAVLFVRSAPIEQCIRNFKSTSIPDNTKIYWLVRICQSVELLERLSLSQDSLITVDRNAFSDDELRSDIGDAVSRLNITAVHIPVNNNDGNGYSSLLKYFSRFNLEIRLMYPDHYPPRHERITYDEYLVRERFDPIIKMVDRVIGATISIIGVPILALLYIFGSRNRKLRAEYGLHLMRWKDRDMDSPSIIYPFF